MLRRRSGRFGLAALTREGWLAMAAAVVLVLFGRLTGTFELVMAGAAIAALVIVAVLFLALTRVQLGVRRTLTPPRVHAGSPARVELVLHNAASRRTPVLQLADEVTGTRGANLLVSPLIPKGSARAAYLLPTEKRGRLEIGPLRIRLGDSFGLARSVVEAVGTSSLLVFPRMDRIRPIPTAASHDPQATARQPNALGRTGDDFYALRPYRVGDDLRRVHWPATAHHDELMIRQHEMPWQERCTVLLDVRSFTQSAESFELCVSAAASVLDASLRGGDQIRLVTTHGIDTGYGLSRAHLDHCLEHLALVQLEQSASLQQSLDLVRREGSGGTLVLIVATLGANDLLRMGALHQRYGRIVTVLFEPSSWDPERADHPPPNGTGTLVRVTKDAAFPVAWDRIVLGGGSGRARRPDDRSTDPNHAGRGS